jgi:hypothetical protein
MFPGSVSAVAEFGEGHVLICAGLISFAAYWPATGQQNLLRALIMQVGLTTQMLSLLIPGRQEGTYCSSEPPKKAKMIDVFRIPTQVEDKVLATGIDVRNGAIRGLAES